MSNRILLVEDNESDVELVRLMFGKECILNPLDIAKDGRAAEEYLFFGQYALPSMVLLDLNLLGADGLHILRQMRGRRDTKDIPVLVLTGSDSDEDLVRSISAGSNSYIRKPLTLMALSQVVKAIGMGFLIVRAEAQDG